ncbi:MAG: hypothetical protein IPM34_00840 [Saprospiraceae bacterium]|nr:hypothetical protein [Saprospiraceae bacterium]
MAGNQTHGYDMVIEVSSQSLQNLLSAVFDNDGFLEGLLPSSLGNLLGFEVALDFNRPPSLPASAVNPVHLSVELNLSLGLSGTLDLVVGMDVNRDASNLDVVIFDFPNKLYSCTLTVSGLPATVTNLAANAIKNSLENNSIPIVPVPVTRTSTNTLDITRADVKVIDDATSVNNDALGVALTFGGGSIGNLNNFTSAFARAGAGAAVAINFSWICRNISPKIEEGIGLPAGSFAGCSFSGEHEIRDGVKLTSMSIRPDDDFIQLSGTVSKSGTCYDASGRFSARIQVAIVAGELRVSFETDDPDIDISIPWYCYLGAAVLGALLGGIIFGVIGAIVGGIIVPLLIYIAESVLESTLESVTQEVTDAINSIEDINVRLVGVENVLDTAFIDDMTVGYNMHPKEYWPVKAEGTIQLRSGDYLDLDTGLVRKENFTGADLKLYGANQSRSIKILCGSSCSSMGSIKPFNFIRRYNLMMLNYGVFGELPLHHFALYFPLPFFQDDYYETRSIFAYKTSDASLGFFQVTDVNEDTFVLRYKTYKTSLHKISISGNFNCRKFELDRTRLELDRIVYTDHQSINGDLRNRMDALNLQKVRIPDLAELKWPQSNNQNKTSTDIKIQSETHASLQKYHKAVGVWKGNYIGESALRTGTFQAHVTGQIKVSNFSWIVDQNVLPSQSEGSIQIKNQKFNYATKDHYLILSSKSTLEFEVPIKLLVVFENGETDQLIRCFNYSKKCKITKRITPGFKDYLEKFDHNFGIVMSK